MIIHLGYPLPNTSSGTHKRDRKKINPCPSTLLPVGVYRASTSRCCWCALTAPLHPYRFGNSLIAKTGGMFLWHCPHDYSHWGLPSKLDLSGARTFLKFKRRRIAAFKFAITCAYLLLKSVYYRVATFPDVKFKDLNKHKDFKK